MANTQTSVTDVFDDFVTSTLKKYESSYEDQIFKKNRLLMWLNRKGKKREQRGGYEILIPVMYAGNNTTQMFQGYDVVNIDPTQGLTNSRWEFRNMTAAVTFSWEEKTANRDAYKLIDLLNFKNDQAILSMQTRLNANFHGYYGRLGQTFGQSFDTATKDTQGGTNYISAKQTDGGFISLDHIVRMPNSMVDPASATARTHTVGGIAVSTTTDGTGGYSDWALTSQTLTAHTNTWWMNQSLPGLKLYDEVNNVPGTIITGNPNTWTGDCDNTTYLAYAMQDLYSRLSDGTAPPDVGLTTTEVVNLYLNSQVQAIRYMDTETADAGFQNAVYQGMTLMTDPGLSVALGATVTAATTKAVPLYMLNSDHLFWYVDPAADFKVLPQRDLPQQLGYASNIVLRGQLCTNRRNAHGVLALATAEDYV